MCPTVTIVVKKCDGSTSLTNRFDFAHQQVRLGSTWFDKLTTRRSPQVERLQRKKATSATTANIKLLKEYVPYCDYCGEKMRWFDFVHQQVRHGSTSSPQDAHHKWSDFSERKRLQRSSFGVGRLTFEVWSNFHVAIVFLCACVVKKCDGSTSLTNRFDSACLADASQTNSPTVSANSPKLFCYPRLKYRLRFYKWEESLTLLSMLYIWFIMLPWQ